LNWKDKKAGKKFLKELENIMGIKNIDINTIPGSISEEEKYIKGTIIALCNKYNFKYQFNAIDNCVYIYSIIDEWYFYYDKQIISLFHKNKLHTTKQYHCQKKFENAIQAILYIKKHDDFYYKPNKNHKYNIYDRIKY
jgi:hypothetical protein